MNRIASLAGYLSWLTVLSLAAGCAGRSAPPVVDPVPRPGEAILGSCKGRLDLSDRRIRFRADYVLQAPDRLYVEVSGAMGGVRAILAVDGGQLAVLLPREEQYFREPATKETFERLLGFPLEASALRELLGFEAPEGPLSGGAGEFLVFREDSRMIVEPAPGTDSELRRLEIRPESIERVTVASLRTGQFNPTVPSGWSRVPLGRAGGETPLLMP